MIFITFTIYFLQEKVRLHSSVMSYFLLNENIGLLLEHCVKSCRIWSFSGPYFPTFGPEKLRIQALFTQWERFRFKVCKTFVTSHFFSEQSFYRKHADDCSLIEESLLIENSP